MARERMRRFWALAAVLGAALALVFGGAGTASAHANLVSTDPAQNSVVPTAPAAVTLTFSEGVSLSSDSVRVLDPGGKPVDNGDPAHTDGKADTARVTLRSGLANGTYTVAWRAVSEDSHPVGGAFVFSIGAASDTSVSASALQTAKADGVVSFVYGLGRTVAYAAFALLAGVAAFVLIVWPRGVAVRQVQRLLMTGWVALLVSTVAVLLLRGPYERGTGISQALDLSLVRTTLDERIGTALAARLLLLAAAGVFLSLLVGQLGASPPAGAAGDAEAEPPAPDDDPEAAELAELEQRAAERPQRDARLGLGLAGLALAIALTATWVGADHSSVGIQVGLALPMAAVHLLAMALWLGGLATLLVGLRHGLPVAGVERFSKLAFGAVAALSVTGLYQSWRGLGWSWSALVDTEYGRLLLVKVGCVAAMVGVAWISRSWTARLRESLGESLERESPGEQESLGERESVGEAEEQGSAATVASGSRSAAASTDGRAPHAAGVGTEREAQLRRQAAAVSAANARAERDGTPARAGLRRTVLLESLVAVAVLVVTTMLTNSPPGRAVEQAKSAAQTGAPAPGVSAVPGRTVELKLPYDTGGRTPNAKGTAVVSVNPAALGPNAVELKLDDASGQPTEVPELQLAFTLPDRDLGPLPVTLKPEGKGRWSGVAQLPLAGNWIVSVTVRSSDIDQVTSVQTLKLGG